MKIFDVLADGSGNWAPSRAKPWPQRLQQPLIQHHRGPLPDSRELNQLSSANEHDRWPAHRITDSLISCCPAFYQRAMAIGHGLFVGCDGSRRSSCATPNRGYERGAAAHSLFLWLHAIEIQRNRTIAFSHCRPERPRSGCHGILARWAMHQRYPQTHDKNKGQALSD